MSVVGVSNLGKSALLRSLTDPVMQEKYLGYEKTGYLPIYIDFNQMLDMTEQAFYELILRCSMDALRGAKNQGQWRSAGSRRGGLCGAGKARQ